MHILQIQPKLEQQLRVAKQMQVIEAVQELLIMEGQNTSDVAGFNGSGNSGVIDAEAYPWLDQEYLYIAQNQQSIR